MKTTPLWGVVAALLAAGCKKETTETTAPDGSAAPSPSVIADASANAEVEKDAAAETDAGALRPASLLEVVPSSLAVSSMVANPHDYPEHLIDGKFDTAWNSKTGDLVGAWIRFTIPDDAKAHAVEMTAGYTRTIGEEDLFLANHRIAKVQVSHNGKVLRTHAFDVDSRAMQRIELDGGGGEYELKVLETVAGTKKQWRELVVSEFRVQGEAGKARRGGDDPLRVGVGGYKLFKPTRPPEPVALGMEGQVFADLEAACAAWPAIAKQMQAKNPTDYGGYRIAYGKPSCAEEAVNVHFTGNETYKALAALRLSDGSATWSVPLVQTAAGFSVIDFRYRVNDPSDPGCPSTVRPVLLDTAVVRSGQLVFTTGSEQGSQCDETADDPALGGYCVVLLQGALWCKEQDGLRCKQYAPEYQEPLGLKDAPKSDPVARKGWGRAGAWRNTIPFTVLANGDFRLRTAPVE